MGSINQGRSPNLRRWRVIARLRRWGLTCEAIGRRLGITRQAVHHCFQEYRQTRTKLSVPQILTWAEPQAVASIGQISRREMGTPLGGSLIFASSLVLLPWPPPSG
jgi:hypothetical protein